MADKRVTKGKIKVFSDTTEPGVIGQLKRAAQWRRRKPIELAGALARAALRRRDPYRLLPFPQSIHIEITNRCNIQCVMCPHPLMTRPQGFMSEELFRRIVGELGGHRLMLENISIMGLGEPLLHPDFEKFVVIASQAGLPNLFVSTNGTPLTESRARRIVEDGALDRMIISLDGASRETYEKVRVGASFERVTGNARRMMEIKKELGKRRPTVTLQILSMPATQPEIDAFCEQWEPLLGDGDEILIKEADTFGGLVTASGPARAPGERRACRMLWKDLAISWDGMVTVCCKDVFYKLTVGRVGEASLAELWKSAKWAEYRRQHLQKQWDRIDPCDRCAEWYL